jgi:glycosyltransferase involved in cell wall biosynthesis
LCAVSRFVASKTLELLQMQERPVEILPNPVDTSMFAPPDSMREEDGLIVFAGTVCEKKGVRQLVQAMPLILQAVPQARLSIIGRDSRDPDGGSYTTKLRESLPDQLKGRVCFEGQVGHAGMPERLARATVCVYPSHMEALPLAWLEGMAMGKCVVASRTGPGPEVIEHGISGLLCDPHDPSAIAEHVIAALTQPALRQRIGAAARARIAARFSESVLVTRNEEFYRRCLGARCA